MIVHINENNLKLIDSAMLLDPNRYQEVEDAVLRVGGSRSPTFALETASFLSEKIDSVLSQMDKGLSEKYFLLLKLLRLYGIRAFNDAEKEQVFREFILELFRSGLVEVLDEVELVFKAYFDAKDIREHYRTMFASGIEKNTEILGQQNIKVFISGEEKLVRPTLQNWLLDYNGNSHVDAETKRRSAFEQTNYMLHSENVKNLSKADRELLLRVIQFYDWLKFDPLNFDFTLPGQKRRQEKVDDIDTPTKLIPDELKSMLEKMRSQQEQAFKSANGLNYMSGQSGVMGEPQAVKPKPVPPQVQKPVVAPPARPPILPPLNKKPEEPRTLMDIKADIENKRRKAQEEIDRKLEELRRKVQK